MNREADDKSEKPASTDPNIYKAYEEHTKTLRAWLVAYGVGAPVLFLSNVALTEAVKTGGQGSTIGKIFLAGVACQVILALLNKNVMWVCHHGATRPVFQTGCLYKLAEKVSRQFWIDTVLDVASIVLMACATFRVFAVVKI